MSRIELYAAFIIWSLTNVTPCYTGESFKLIKDNQGGDAYEFIDRMDFFKKEGTNVVIDGHCMSACTFYMTLPNFCATPNAKFYFHSAMRKYMGIGAGIDPETMRNFARTYTTQKAFDLQERYDSFHMMYADEMRDPVKLENGVYRVFLNGKVDGEDVVYETLRVDAKLLVPECETISEKDKK